MMSNFSCFPQTSYLCRCVSGIIARPRPSGLFSRGSCRTGSSFCTAGCTLGACGREGALCLHQCGCLRTLPSPSTSAEGSHSAARSPLSSGSEVSWPPCAGPVLGSHSLPSPCGSVPPRSGRLACADLQYLPYSSFLAAWQSLSQATISPELSECKCVS